MNVTTESHFRRATDELLGAEEELGYRHDIEHLFRSAYDAIDAIRFALGTKECTAEAGEGGRS